MNEVIYLLKNHRSIRGFEEKHLTTEQVQTIVEAAQSASTSSFIQAYSIIGITDPAKKKRLSELVGNQSYVEKNGYFLVFCADLYRHQIASELEGVDVSESLESTEKFMVATIDASLAAQNAAIAAESLGLGICYIGGLRNNLPEVTKLLNTPDRVVPLFGMAIGYPTRMPLTKPRLPLTAIFHENEYNANIQDNLAEYNQEISAYYKKRTSGKREDRWTEQITKTFLQKSRMYMKEFLHSKKMADK